MHLSRDDDVIFQSFSKMYATLKEIFGESGKGYDDWKGSFSFPFLIHFKKEEQEFSYLINIHNIRSSIEFKLAKLICADDESFERGVFHHPFQDFPREEIKYFTNYLVGFLAGYFESAKGHFDEYFLKQWSLILSSLVAKMVAILITTMKPRKNFVKHFKN